MTRWASTAFGAGAGLGSAYTECSQKFGGYPGKSTASISETPITKVMNCMYCYFPSLFFFGLNGFPEIEFNLVREGMIQIGCLSPIIFGKWSTFFSPVTCALLFFYMCLA